MYRAIHAIQHRHFSSGLIIGRSLVSENCQRVDFNSTFEYPFRMSSGPEVEGEKVIFARYLLS